MLTAKPYIQECVSTRGKPWAKYVVRLHVANFLLNAFTQRWAKYCMFTTWDSHCCKTGIVILGLEIQLPQGLQISVSICRKTKQAMYTLLFFHNIYLFNQCIFNFFCQPKDMRPWTCRDEASWAGQMMLTISGQRNMREDISFSFVAYQCKLTPGFLHEN